MIVIIGAGLAGLAAAHRLIASNHTDLYIVEAKQRAGGRIESRFLEDGSRIDMGAQWLHGENSNPVYKWLLEMDCIECSEEEECEFEGLFRTQFGSNSPDEAVVSRVLELLMDAKSMLYKISPMMDTRCKPIEIFQNHIKLEATKCPVLKSADQKLVEAVTRWFLLYEVIDNSCENMSLLGLRAYSQWKDFDDGRMVRLKGGWQSVVDKLVQAIGREKIIFSNPVKRVKTVNDKLELQLSTGSPIHCDHVIVTFSAGLMKSSMDSDFFVPKLELSKRDKIQRIGFGVVNKIFLQFERPFLAEEKGLKLLWMDCDEDQHTTERSHELSKLPRWCKDITGFDTVSNAPNCLLAWIGAEGAREMESFSDSEIGKVCMQIFNIFIPDKQPPLLIAVHPSRWASDSFIGGSYSYQSEAASNYDLRGLWDPIPGSMDNRQTQQSLPRVLFAGEATAGEMYSTAHGAIISGWREADRILTLNS